MEAVKELEEVEGIEARYIGMVEEDPWSTQKAEVNSAQDAVPSPPTTAAPLRWRSFLPSAWLLSLRWSLLLPLYGRVDLPGLRGFAVVELMVIAVYLSINVYYLSPLLYAMTVPQLDFPTYMVAMVRGSFRLGTVGTWNVLALWLPVTRHSIWNYFLGISFDRSLFYHIWISRLAILILTLHGLGLYAWMLWKQTFLTDLTDGGLLGEVPTGSIALLGGLLLVVTSVDFVRRRWWELFYRCHYVGLMGFTVFSLLHDRMVLKVTIAGVALFGVDCLIRCYQWTRPVEVLDLRVMKEGGGDITRIEWRLSPSSPSAPFRFDAGQFVLVCIPLISPFEWHPYSISSSPHHPTVVLHSQRKGRWTSRLEALARSFDPSHPIRMYVEGPYGTLSVPLPRYRHVMLVSGGVGVTPMLSLYHHLMEGHVKGREVNGQRKGMEMEKVQFVWTMKDSGLIGSLWGDIERLYDHPIQTGPPSSPPPPFPAMQTPPSFPVVPSSSPSSPTPDAFCPVFHVTSSTFTGHVDSAEMGVKAKWSVTKGRPQLNSLFAAMKREMTEREGPTADGGHSRCAVLVCGPDALIQRCRRLCLRYSDSPWQMSRCQRIGSGGCFFDLHEETYKW